jgi:nucleoid DNA-binding protein
MDELTKVLMEKAGLTEAQAKAAAEAVIEYMKHEDNRKKLVVLAGASAAIASAVAVRTI